MTSAVRPRPVLTNIADADRHRHPQSSLRKERNMQRSRNRAICGATYPQSKHTLFLFQKKKL